MAVDPRVNTAVVSGSTDERSFRHPITRKWPAQHPERIQLYPLPTPNDVKVSVMPEETGLPYEPHLVRFDTNGQISPEFLLLNLNNKIQIGRAHV